MYPIPPNEKTIETKKCKISGQEFFVTDKDLEFYDKVSPVYGGKKYMIPSPTLCPIERQRRRLAYRNERKLYHRKCDKTGKQLLSNYSSDKPFPIFHREYWMSDDHNPLTYGRELNFDTPFFQQMKLLSNVVPRLHAQQWIPIENSEYSNYVSNCENCYLVFDSDFDEDCLYCNVTNSLKDCVDCSIVERSRNCFECINCTESHYLFFSSNSNSCRESWFLDNCIGCESCALCVNMRNKRFCFNNEQLSKEDYQKKLATLFAGNKLRNYRQNFYNYAQKFPHKYYQGTNTENATGDRIVNAKNVKCSFGIYECEDIAYCDLLLRCKNCMDVSSFGTGIGWIYEGSTVGLNSQNCIFGCTNILNCSNLVYCYIAHSARNCFGCIGIKHGTNNCILNKAYGQHEYEELCGKIIDHMRSTDEWGEFFPYELCPFGYNETIAHEYLPLEKEEVLKKGWKWKDEDETSSYHGQYYTPLNIDQYDEKEVGYETAQKNIDAVLDGILLCEMTGKPFKIIRQELAFYIENSIPLPTKHPDQRHKERMNLKNPQILFERTCDECKKQLVTTYAPERPEKVVCEECYRKLVY